MGNESTSSLETEIDQTSNIFPFPVPGSQYDKDKNKLVEGSELRGFYLWIDVNSNYKLDPGELHDLDDYGIISISTVHDGSYKSSAFKKDGSKMLIEDLWFSRR